MFPESDRQDEFRTIVSQAEAISDEASLKEIADLQARAMANGPAWLTGLGMAAITHLLFGVLLVLTLLVASGAGEWTSMESWWQLPAQALFFAFVSLSLTGVVTLPATAWIAHRVARHYQKELASEPA